MSTPSLAAELPPIRPENHLPFATAAALFSATIARIFAEQSTQRARLHLERARLHVDSAAR